MGTKDCATHIREDEESPQSYSLRSLGSRVPTTLAQLKRWLRAGKNRDWDGKSYVASTICWDGMDFRQWGCSPNYLAGWWTLACCKHDMRRGRPFRAKVEDHSIPTYVFTFAKQDDHGRQALVSVAEVQKDFPTMKEYAEFVLRRNRQFRLSRLTRVRPGSELGRQFGDCHADEKGRVGKPNGGHVHAQRQQWRRDIDKTHVILVSRRFTVWDRPVFLSRHVLKQSRFGHNVRSGELDDVLMKAG